MRNKIFILFLEFLIISSYIYGQAGRGRGRIAGTVLDETGAPLADVIVVAESLTESGTKLEGRTNAKGEWAIAGFGTGMWRLTASKDGYAPSFLDLRVSEFRNPPVTFTLKKLKGAAVFAQDKEAMELFEKGSKAVEEGRYDDAISIYNAFFAKYPSLFHVLLNIGDVYMKKGELEKAIEKFQEVLNKLKARDGDFSKEPTTAYKALAGIGEVHVKKGDFDKAREYFEKALVLSPKDEGLAYSVGEIYFNNLKVDEAIKYFELAVQIKSDWWKPYAKLGYCYLNKGDFQKALECFNKSIEVDPQSPEVGTIKAIIAEIEKMIKKK